MATATLEVVMYSNPARDIEQMPPGWARHLLRVFPHGPRRDATRMRPHLQLHSMRRDEAGRFNRLEGGKPAFAAPFERDLEAAVRDMRFELGLVQGDGEYEAPRNPVEAVDPHIIAAAVAAVRASRPDLGPVLEFFMTPRRLRRWTADGMASELGLACRSSLYDRRDVAVLAVWAAMPPDARSVAWGDLP